MKIQPNKYFGITAESIKTESFNVSITNHPAKSEISTHAHAKPYLCLLASGIYKEESNTSNLITTGDVLYRTANYEHANRFSNQDSVCLNIEIDNESDFMSHNDFKLPLTQSKQNSSLETYKVLYAVKHGLSNDLLNIYCYESMLAHVDAVSNSGDLKWIEQVKEYINDNPLSPISLQQLSLMFGLHPNYIVRKFKGVTGMKLSDYLTKIRLEYSISNLIMTDESLTKIALKSGFYDQSHFNRNFKKYLETTPKHFRKVITG
jgi:AraC-like DNA-binding protein